MVKGVSVGTDEAGAGKTAPPIASKGRTIASPLALPVGLTVMVVTLVLVVLAAQPPAPRPATAPATAPASEFSAARAMATLERLLGDGVAHPVASPANAEVAARIDAELAAMGYTVETQATFACRAAWAICGSVTNVMSRLPGTIDGPAVLLTAHYDSVPAGPGAGDDMAGVAVILEVARILREEAPPRNPVIFLFSDGEEPALLGAEAFVAEHPWAGEVGVVVNLEANGTHGQSVLFQTTGNKSGWLIDTFAAHAPRPVASSVFDAIYALLPFNTDLTVYGEAGLPGLNFAFIEEHPRYHTPLDAPANLSQGSLQHHGDNALAAVRSFSAADLANSPPGRAVYQDVLPGVVVRWPEPWTLALAIAAAGVWIGVGVGAMQRGDLSWRAFLWGLSVFPFGVAGSTLLGLGLASLVSAVSGAATPWYAHPLPIRAAVGTAAIAWMVLGASVVARRAGFWGIFLGVWLWWAVSSVLASALMPGISPLVLLPSAVAAIAAGLVAISPLRTSPRAWQTAALVGLAGAGWFWLGFTRGSDYSALGPDLGPAVGFVVGLTASALAPLVAPWGVYGRWWRPAIAGAALLALAAVVVALRVPIASEARPLRVNLLHVQDRQSGQARWAIEDQSRSGGGEASGLGAIVQAGEFAAEPVALLPWSTQSYPVAAASPVADRAPVAALLRDEETEGERVVRLELRSAAPDHRVTLYIPDAAGLRRVDIVGVSSGVEGFPIEDGYGRFHCVGADCDGLELDLHMGNGGALTLYAAERMSGLPEDGSVLTEARPETAAPSGGGDETIVVDRVELEGS